MHGTNEQRRRSQAWEFKSLSDINLLRIMARPSEREPRTMSSVSYEFRCPSRRAISFPVGIQALRSVLGVRGPVEDVSWIAYLSFRMSSAGEAGPGPARGLPGRRLVVTSAPATVRVSTSLPCTESRPHPRPAGVRAADQASVVSDRSRCGDRRPADGERVGRLRAASAPGHGR